MKKNTKSAKADVFIVIFFLFFAAFSINLFRLDLLQSIRLQNVEPAGTVIIKKNTVQRRLGNRVLWDRLANESPVYVGDLIRVADVSAATLNIENNSIELDENTLIRILLSPDGKGLQIELNSGNLSLSSTDNSQSLTLDLNGQKVRTTPGTVFSAVSDDSGVTLKVSAGTVQIMEEEGVREISSGEMIAVDPEGTERAQKAVVVTQPVPNARFLKTGSGDLAINFEWNRINLSPDDFLRLEIATDRSFGNITQTINNLDRRTQVTFNPGLWHWRLFLGGAVLSEGRLTVTEAGVQLISPAPNSVLRYQSDLPVMNFQWTEAEDASFYILEVSDEPNFRNPSIRRQGSASFYADSTLGRGAWYWRVMAVLPSVYEGGDESNIAYSQTAVFRIEQSLVESREERIEESSNVSLADWLAAESTPLPAPSPSMRTPASAAVPLYSQEPAPVAPTASTPAANPVPTPSPATAPASTPTPAPRPASAQSTVTLLQPAEDFTIDGLTALNQQTVFRWNCDTAIARSMFVLSQNQNPLRGRPAIEISNPDRTIRVDRLGEGTWYWTVEVMTASGLTVSAPPRRLKVLPIPLLAAPQNLRPLANYRFGIEQIVSQKEITFEWAAVEGANGYFFALYRQTDSGRLQIVNEDPQTQTSFTLDDLKVLDKGTYVWQIEAVSQGRGGVIERRGMPAQSTFIVDFPSPGPVKIEDTGVLYGN